MSVAVALKNVILMSLIILILHFLIKNMLVEAGSRKEDDDMSDDSSTSDLALVCTATNPAVCAIAKHIPEEEEPKRLCGEKASVDPSEELHRFVFEETSELEKFFVPAPEDAPEKSNCKEQVEVVKESKKRNAKNATLSFFNEYKDEGQMNSGDPFGTGLMAFDAFDNKFGDYAGCSGDAAILWDESPLGPAPTCADLNK